MTVQEFGPFKIFNQDHMKEFCGIVLALLVAELEPTEEGELLETKEDGRIRVIELELGQP